MLMNKDIKFNRGFTIIELVVVIAIIATLAAIVLINVTGYINKGKDAARKEDMHTYQTNVISNNAASGDYSSECGTATADLAWTAAQGGDTTYSKCNKTSTAWCACIKEFSPSTETYFCVDSTGSVKEQATTAAITSCTVECPAETAACQ